MCIICIELDKNKLSPWEAKANLSEMVEEIGLEHVKEVENKISDIILNEEICFSAFCSLHIKHNTKND